MDSQFTVTNRLDISQLINDDQPSTDLSNALVVSNSVEGDPLSRIISFVPWYESTGYECASGMLISDTCHGLPFCPIGNNVPGPGYPGVAQNRLTHSISRLWDVPLSRLKNGRGLSIELLGSAHDTSVGAMLAASHCGNHSCLSFAVRMVTGVSIPHDFVSLSASTSLIRWVRVRCDAGDMVFARLTVTMDGVTDVHVVPLCTTSRGRFTYRLDGVSDHMEICVYDALPDATGEMEGATITCGHSVGPVGCCPPAPATGHVCSVCCKFVNTVGHGARCRGVKSRSVDPLREVVYRRAQLGDAFHKTDVTVAMMYRRVPEKRRTHQISLWINGAAQASYMKHIGKSGDNRMLATWFEAMYPAIRRSYLSRVFPEIPFGVFPVVPEFEQVAVADDVFFWDKPLDDYVDCWRAVYAYVVMDSAAVKTAQDVLTHYEDGGVQLWSDDLKTAMLALRDCADVDDVDAIVLHDNVYVLEKVGRLLTYLFIWDN